jgi:hypothetical protein
MTQKMFEVLEELKTEYDDIHQRRLDDLAAAQQILTDLCIPDVLDHITPKHITILQDTLWNGAHQLATDAGRYWITINLPADLKPLLRPCLIRHFDLQHKEYYVDKLWGITDSVPQLIERWEHQWDRITNDRGASAWNQLRIQWYQPAVEGEAVSGDCIIQTVTDHTIATTNKRLAVVCQKPDSN